MAEPDTAPTRAQVIAEDHDVWAFVAMDTVGPLTERVKALVETGRPMTVIGRWLDRDAPLEVKNGLRAASTDGGVQPLQVWHQGDPQGSGFRVLCSPGLHSWGFGAYADEAPTEAEVRRRFHDEHAHDRRQNITSMSIEGWATSRTTIVTIDHWNQYGVGFQTVVSFAPSPSAQEVAEAEAAVVTTLADARTTWRAAELRQMANTARREWATIAEVTAGS